MRKTTIFLATVALSCCGLSSSFAQIRIVWDNESSTSTTRLVAAQAEVSDEQAGTAREVLENPFDLLTGDAAVAAPAVADAVRSPSEAVIRTPAADPTSLPATRPTAIRNAEQAAVDYSMLEGVPAASLAPVMWTQTCRTPNPVAEVLLRQDCNQKALWANYPAEHAAECAAMWNNIAGHQDCGCAAPVANCQICPTCPQSVGNRYSQPARFQDGRPYAAGTACDRQANLGPVSVARVPNSILR